MARKLTAKEVRGQVIEHIYRMVKYWSELPGLSVEDRCDGVAFSLLTMLDGAAVVPRFTLTVESDDKEYPDGLVINADCDLHDVYSEYRRLHGK